MHSKNILLLLCCWLNTIHLLGADSRSARYEKVSEECLQGSVLTTKKICYMGECTLACSNRMDCGAYQLDRTHQFCILLCLGGQCDAFKKLEEICAPEGGSIYQKQMCVLQSVANAAIDSVGAVVNAGSTVTYACLPGHQYSDNTTTKHTTCSGFQQWTLEVPDCQLMTCTVQSVSNSANNASGPVEAYGTTVTYTCNIGGYEFSDRTKSKQAQCIGMEQWSATLESSCEESLVSSGSSWQQVGGALKWVSSGQAGVWGANSGNMIYHMSASYRSVGGNPTTGTSWVFINSGMKQVSVGFNIVWAVHTNDAISYRIGISSSTSQGFAWTQVSGSLMRISIASKLNNTLWGTNSGYAVHRRIGMSSSNVAGLDWKHISGISAKDISVDYSGVWAVTTNNQVYYRTGTYAVANSDGSGWQYVPGELMKQITSGFGSVWAVNQATSCAYYKQGQTPTNPIGDAWVRVDSSCNVNQVSVSAYGGATWKTDNSDGIFFRVGTNYPES